LNQKTRLLWIVNHNLNNYYKANIDLVKKKEDNKLSLRRKELDNLLNEKRTKITSEHSNLEVQISSLKIPNELLQYDFTNIDFTLQLKDLLFNEKTSIDLIKFALIKIRDNTRLNSSKDFIRVYMSNGFVEILLSNLKYNDINILVKILFKILVWIYLDLN